MEPSIRFGSIKVPLTVGSGKESSIYEVKICMSDLTVATAAARTVSMYGQVMWIVIVVVLGGRSMRVGRACAVIRFCIDVIPNMQQHIV